MSQDEAENVPEITVERGGTTIEVTDRATAEAALPFIEGAIEYYLGDESERRKQRQWKPVEVQCQRCDYEWTYTGRRATGATCPDCNKHTQFEPNLRERGVR